MSRPTLIIKGHPRTAIVEEARHMLATAVLAILKKHRLTYLELISLLAREIKEWSRYGIRTERHGANPNELGGDDAPADPEPELPDSPDAPGALSWVCLESAPGAALKAGWHAIAGLDEGKFTALCGHVALGLTSYKDRPPDNEPTCASCLRLCVPAPSEPK